MPITSQLRPLFLLVHALVALLVLLSQIPIATRAANLPYDGASSINDEEEPAILKASGITVDIDAGADLKPISADIYGMNYPNERLAADLLLPVQRWGGNATTRYNYLADISNRGSDWFFQNTSESKGAALASLPRGSSADRFVEQGLRTGTASLMTIPMIGWVARSDSPRNHPLFCGFSTTKYGPQNATEFYSTHCGTGYTLDNKPIINNDPGDTSQPANPEFMRGWMEHLVGRFGKASAGGVRYFNLDNEPSLWTETHRDIRKEPLGYEELRDRTYAYGSMIKSVDPSAKTLGPAEWGWNAYFYSARDAYSGNKNPDRAAHGNKPLVQWYLEQMRTYEERHGTRILDYLDLHYYPQASNVALKPAGDAATQALRLRSTRSLWDPTYNDESWISTQPDGPAVRLIPRMRDWVNSYYPGTKLAITEYNWGGLEHINGALAQADVLGIFGREGVDVAMLWDPPASEQPGAFAFRMYLNYDGKGGRFGSTSVRATSSSQEQLAVYAARRVDGALTLMVVNKSPQEQRTTLNLNNFAAAPTAAVYRYSGANLKAITREANIAVASSFAANFPGDSITLIVLEPVNGMLSRKLYLPLVRSAGSPALPPREFETSDAPQSTARALPQF